MKTYYERLHDLIGISQNEYTNHFLDSGQQFLLQYNQGDQYGASCLMATHEFWQWYKREWDLIDQVFLETYHNTRPQFKSQLNELWYRRHDPSKIISLLDQQVLNAGYQYMKHQKQAI